MTSPYKIRLKIQKEAYLVLRDAGYKLCVGILVTDENGQAMRQGLVPTVIDLQENMEDILWEPPRTYAMSYATEYPQIPLGGNADEIMSRIARTTPRSIDFGEQFDAYHYQDATVQSQDNEEAPITNGFRFNNHSLVCSALLYREACTPSRLLFRTPLWVPGSGSIVPHARRAVLWFQAESKSPIVSTKHASYTWCVDFKDEEVVSADPLQGIETVYYTKAFEWNNTGFPKEGKDCTGYEDEYQNEGFNPPTQDTNGNDDSQNEGFQDPDDVPAKTDVPQLPNGTIPTGPPVLAGLDQMSRSDLIGTLSLLLGKLQTTAIST